MENKLKFLLLLKINLLLVLTYLLEKSRFVSIDMVKEIILFFYQIFEFLIKEKFIMKI